MLGLKVSLCKVKCSRTSMGHSEYFSSGEKKKSWKQKLLLGEQLHSTLWERSWPVPWMHEVQGISDYFCRLKHQGPGRGEQISDQTKCHVLILIFFPPFLNYRTEFLCKHNNSPFWHIWHFLCLYKVLNLHTNCPLTGSLLASRKWPFTTKSVLLICFYATLSTVYFNFRVWPPIKLDSFWHAHTSITISSSAHQALIGRAFLDLSALLEGGFKHWHSWDPAVWRLKDA